ncbi:hypothetical protein Tco_1159315, partial [Tanacetum coccineum]
IPNEHQLKFNSIKDAKKLLEAVEKRFGGNAVTRKTQSNLLEEQYGNFTALSSNMLDQTFDMLQKLRSCTKASDNAGQARKETKPVKDYILLPLWIADPPYSQDLKSSHDDRSKPSSDDEKEG